MSSFQRKMARRKDAEVRGLALIALEVTARTELEEVLDAIQKVHERYCAECRAGGARHLHWEGLAR